MLPCSLGKAPTIRIKSSEIPYRRRAGTSPDSKSSEALYRRRAGASPDSKSSEVLYRRRAETSPGSKEIRRDIRQSQRRTQGL